MASSEKDTKPKIEESQGTGEVIILDLMPST
jgi:hypothetical protein